ncbi:hypothetical protein AVEN_195142-1 [Araneus ventricosus]|uniref:Uncharacterized protein n=1 Tax=Araneus ventricosus TaxID=182803 RepID=A0A4Y2BI66_ARAVE|nr:hypothetical protein AVEN_195142-1 [Araneus ventricosus]
METVLKKISMASATHSDDVILRGRKRTRSKKKRKSKSPPLSRIVEEMLKEKREKSLLERSGGGDAGKRRCIRVPPMQGSDRSIVSVVEMMAQ